MKRAVKEKELEKEKTEKAVSEEKETKEAAASEKENKETSEKEEKASEKKKDPKDEKIDELNDKLKRSMAEFDNYRKRTDKEKSAMYEIGAKDVIEKILPIVDNFERGLNSIPEDAKGSAFADGMEKIYKQFVKTLAYGLRTLTISMVNMCSIILLGTGTCLRIVVSGWRSATLL